MIFLWTITPIILAAVTFPASAQVGDASHCAKARIEKDGDFETFFLSNICDKDILLIYRFNTGDFDNPSSKITDSIVSPGIEFFVETGLNPEQGIAYCAEFAVSANHDIDSHLDSLKCSPCYAAALEEPLTNFEHFAPWNSYLINRQPFYLYNDPDYGDYWVQLNAHGSYDEEVEGFDPGKQKGYGIRNVISYEGNRQIYWQNWENLGDFRNNREKGKEYSLSDLPKPENCPPVGG